MSSSLRTPLYECHVALGAQMVEFSGWDMPVSYSGIIPEHQATRQSATMFDTCHMGRFLATGPTAGAAVDRLVTQDLNILTKGRCRYGFLLNEQGGILDDLIVYRLATDRWMLVVNAGTRKKDWNWINERVPASANLQDVSATLSKIDVQGPTSGKAIRRVIGFEPHALPYFGFATAHYRNVEVLVSQTGYTGEFGCELYLDTERVADLWHDLLAAGVQPAGLGARDTLRLEAGLPLYGHELSEAVTPVEANMLRYLKKSTIYIGRAAVEQRRIAGPKRLLVGFRTGGRQTARNGNTILVEGREIGQVTSGSFAPTIGEAIGMAYVESAQAAPSNRIGIDTGRKILDAEVVSLPFYRRRAQEKQA